MTIDLKRLLDRYKPGACKHCSGGPSCDACLLAEELRNLSEDYGRLVEENKRLTQGLFHISNLATGYYEGEGVDPEDMDTCPRHGTDISNVECDECV